MLLGYQTYSAESDRRLESHYLENDIEISTANGLDIDLNESWINNVSENKKIGLRKIKTKIDTEGGYTFEMIIMYILVGSFYVGENIILHLSSDTIDDILAELTQKMNAWITEYISAYFENNFSFSLTLIDESYIMIQWNNYNSGTFKIKLYGDFANKYFSFQPADYENIDSYEYVTLNNSMPNVYLYPAAVDGSDVNVYTPLPNYELTSLYFHWSISNDINNYICEVNMIAEHK
jgi:hypothetical protein